VGTRRFAQPIFYPECHPGFKATAGSEPHAEKDLVTGLRQMSQAELAKKGHQSVPFPLCGSQKSGYQMCASNSVTSLCGLFKLLNVAHSATDSYSSRDASNSMNYFTQHNFLDLPTACR